MKSEQKHHKFDRLGGEGVFVELPAEAVSWKWDAERDDWNKKHSEPGIHLSDDKVLNFDENQKAWGVSDVIDGLAEGWKALEANQTGLVLDTVLNKWELGDTPRYETLAKNGDELIYDAEHNKWFAETPSDEKGARTATAMDGEEVYYHRDEKFWYAASENTLRPIQEGAESQYRSFEGYPVKDYPAEVETLGEHYDKQLQLIDRFKERFFDHAENNIDVPASRLDEHIEFYTAVRKAESGLAGEDLKHAESKSNKVAAMVAGALFNQMCDTCGLVLESERTFAIETLGDEKFNQRYSDVKDVEALRAGVQNDHSNDGSITLKDGKTTAELHAILEQDMMMLLVGRPAGSKNEVDMPPLQEVVRYAHSKDKVDEFFGEPVKILQLGVKSFYNTRAQKVGLAMKSMDQLGDKFDDLLSTLADKAKGSVAKERFGRLSEEITDYKDAAKTAIQTASFDPDYKDSRSDVSMQRHSVERVMREIKHDNIDKNDQVIKQLTEVADKTVGKFSERESAKLSGENLGEFFLENKMISQLEKHVDLFADHVDRMMGARVEFVDTTKYLAAGIDHMLEIAQKDVAQARGNGKG
jgi:hypothetical protein